MEIYDIFTFCTVSIGYDLQSGLSSFLFTDILSKKKLILSKELVGEINEYLKNYMDNYDEIPLNIGFLGQFVHDSNYIYPMELYSMQIFKLKTVNCYIKKIDKGLILIDEITNMPVSIEIMSEEESNSLSNLVNSAYLDPDCDFSINGDYRLTCIGNTEIQDNLIRFLHDDDFYMSTTESVVFQLFGHICNINE